MPAIFLVLIRFFRIIRDGLKDPEFRGLFYWVLGILGLGTWFYARVEGWGVLDSLYFSVITLTTVGYGDFSPQTPAGKIFTILYIHRGHIHISRGKRILCHGLSFFSAKMPAKVQNV